MLVTASDACRFGAAASSLTLIKMASVLVSSEDVIGFAGWYAGVTSALSGTSLGGLSTIGPATCCKTASDLSGNPHFCSERFSGPPSARSYRLADAFARFTLRRVQWFSSDINHRIDVIINARLSDR